MRFKSSAIILYGFGDASGMGFGNSILTKDGTKIKLGVWGSDDDDKSSNCKESKNTVESIKNEVKSGNIKNAEIFFFTDNSTVELAFNKGNLSSKRLFELVLELKLLQLESESNFFIFHVSGERMKRQGTDGLSRGDMSKGILMGEHFMNFIPLNRDAFVENNALKVWLKEWTEEDLEFLTPEDWFVRGHDILNQDLITELLK